MPPGQVGSSPTVLGPWTFPCCASNALLAVLPRCSWHFMRWGLPEVGGSSHRSDSSAGLLFSEQYKSWWACFPMIFLFLTLTLFRKVLFKYLLSKTCQLPENGGRSFLENLEIWHSVLNSELKHSLLFCREALVKLYSHELFEYSCLKAF